jgi:signal transduction histidine kinase
LVVEGVEGSVPRLLSRALETFVPGGPGNVIEGRDFGVVAAHNPVMVVAAAREASAPCERAGAMRVAGAVAIAGLSLALLCAALVLTFLDGASGWWVAASGAVVAPAFAGVLIALQRPENLIGWLLLVDAVVVGFAFVVAPYAHYGLVSNAGSLPGARWALLWNTAGWPSLFAVVVAIVFVFPDGRLPTGRWRPVAFSAVAAFVLLQISALFQSQGYAAPYAGESNPLPALPGLVQAALVPLWIVAFASLFAAVWAVRVRFRRADGVQRLQLLWLAYGALLIPLALVVCLAEGLVGGRADSLTGVVLVAALTVVPASIGVALLRYRLLDIELVLSRTLVYAVLTACVVGGYLAVFLVLDRLVPVRGLAGVIAAGLVALAFQPLRAFLQHRVERLVYGERSDPYAALAHLGQRLETAPDPAQVSTTIVDDVSAAFRLGYCAIALGCQGDGEIAAERGRSGHEPQMVVPLSYQGEVIGELIAEPAPKSTLTSADRRLLEDLARQAGVALHRVRLLADLQRSRERLVLAREEERLRLRRDLHDGLGPTLAALVFKTGLVRDNVRRDPERADRLLQELGSETRDAIADIRRLVYGLRPPELDELGLTGALHEHATQLADDARLDVNIDADDLPALSPAVEVAAYRIVIEALTNAARHAHATRCDVAVRLNGDLQLEITDDGIGLPEPLTAGVGLRSMRERAGELGGSVDIGRAPNAGTRVAVRLPLAS